MAKETIFRKILTHTKFGPREEVTVAGKTMTLRAGLARRKGAFVRKYPTRDQVQRESRKGRTDENRRWKGPDSNNGTKDTTTVSIGGWNPRAQEPLGTAGRRKKAIYDMLRLKIMERVVATSRGLRRRNGTLWRCRPPPKRKKPY
jgi:hypothetical protein